MIHPDFSLDGRHYTPAELAHLCRAYLSDQSLPGFERDLYGFLQEWLDERPDIVVRTSGSTACPKKIRLQKSHMIASARLSGAYFGFQPGQKALLCLPVRYIAGKMMIVRALVWGMDLISSMPQGNPLLGMEDTPVYFAAMVPSQVYSILSDPATREQIKRIHTLILGGGEVPPDLEAQLRGLPNLIYATYGMTETITHVALRRINGEEPAMHYTALPGVRFRQDERGCLVIQAAHLDDEGIFTNDIVDLIDDAHFHFLGRADNVINSGGIKLFPEQLERKIARFLTQRYYITAGPDARLGQHVVLVIEGKPFDTEDLMADFRLHLERHEVPREILFIEALPESSGGKIRRIYPQEKSPEQDTHGFQGRFRQDSNLGPTA